MRLTRQQYREWRARTIQYLDRRKRSYFTLAIRLFRKEKLVAPMDQMALADFARFCRAAPGQVLGKTDRETFILIGRQQAFARLTEHLSLTAADLFRLYSSTEHPPTLEDDDHA